MKAAISAKGPEPNSEVSPRIGTAAYWVVFDSDAGGITACRNRPAGGRSGREAEIEAAGKDVVRRARRGFAHQQKGDCS